MIEQAVLLCAGKGTRLGPITSHTPKPLVQVGGKPFVCWFIEDLVDVGVKDIILLTGYLSDRFNFLRELYPEVRLVKSDVIVNTGVMGIRDLKYKFLLGNGDCYPIFNKSNTLESLLEVTRNPSVCVKVKNDPSIDKGTPFISDCGLATIDKEAVSMGLINCGSFTSMRGLLQDYTIVSNLHINDSDGLEVAERWLSGKTSIVSSQVPTVVNL